MHPPARGHIGVAERRKHLLMAAAFVIAAGLVVHFLGSGPLADSAGDALYAVMVYLVVGVALPRTGVVFVAMIAAGICAVIEVFQLTGLPAAWAQSFWPVRLVLGVRFDPRDLIFYALGACAAASLDVAIRRRRDAI